MIHGRNPHWKMPEVEPQLELSPSRPVVGARVAHLAGGRTAEAGEMAGRLEVAAAVALAQTAVAAVDLGTVTPGAEDVAAKDEGGGRQMATLRTMTGQTTGMTNTISRPVEEAVDHPRQARQTR